MFLTMEKLEKRVEELDGHRYNRNKSIPIPSFRMWVDESADVGIMPPTDAEWQALAVGEHWGGWDMTAWLKVDIVIPEQWRGLPVVCVFDIGRTGGGNTYGFESLLYVNGVPYQGVDSNHKEVFFPQEYIGKRTELLFKVWCGLSCWHNGIEEYFDLRVERAELTVLEPEADDLYYTACAALGAVKVLDKNNSSRPPLLAAIDRAFAGINWRFPGDEAFYASVSGACRSLKEELALLPRNNDVTVNCIGHTHIDVAWLWRLKHTREKAARSFASVLRLMEQYPEYVFLQTQPQLYEDLERDYPELFRRIRQRVKEGRWEAEGAMWLESDCNIPSGESLVRQLLTGMRYYERQFGLSCQYLWLPDVFGYSWALPQILSKSGLKYFMTTKISWNIYNRFPHDTFLWRGIDGTEILTHYITTTSAGKRDDTPISYTYNGEIHADTVTGIWEAYRDKAINHELLLAYGYGDGGGGPSREMLELRRRLEHMPGMPRTVTGRADEYFQRLGERVEETDRYVHRWDGELYLELHRGTYTSQAYNKRMNRRMERLLHDAELLSLLDSTLSEGRDYPQAQLNESWKIVLRNQFHDILPGSSIKEVYEDCREEYAEAERLAEEVLLTGIGGLASLVNGGAGSTPCWLIVNTLAAERDELIRLPWQAEFTGGQWCDADGEAVECERVKTKRGDELLLHVKGIPGSGYTTVTMQSVVANHGERASLDEPPIVVHENGVSTPFYEIVWNEQGQWTRMFDKRLQREIVKTGEVANRLDVHEDKPHAHETWEIDIFYYEKMWQIDDLQSVEVIENGRLRTVVAFTWRYGESTVEQDVVFYTYNPRIDFVTRVDWQERQQLLKAAFPVDVQANKATYEIQFGHVERPTHWNTSWDYARFETCAQQWIDYSERGLGVSLLNNCKYGHDVRDGVMRITLIKSGIIPDPGADLGEHLFTYSLLPHGGDWFEAGTGEQARQLNSPLLVAPLQAERSVSAKAAQLPGKISFLMCDARHVIVDTIKRAEDDDAWIIRCYEGAGTRGSARFELFAPIASLEEVNLMEREGTALPYDGHSFVSYFKPFQLKTFKLRLALP
ncbi:alpha-mannosidase [Paenibacillus chungangensis]|uniref:Alpha-mannosidase n=1 Tax=Paenibacillus chungangensis TaxID=696535 RepID=A0ABW3HXL5_9BACL